MIVRRGTGALTAITVASRPQIGNGVTTPSCSIRGRVAPATMPWKKKSPEGRGHPLWKGC